MKKYDWNAEGTEVSWRGGREGFEGVNWNKDQRRETAIGEFVDGG